MKILTIFLISLIFPVRVISASAASYEIAIIVNNNYPASRITLQDVKAIYLGKKQYEMGVRITPIDQDGTSLIKKKFVEQVLSTSIENYIRHWLKKAFQEGSLSPVIKTGSQEVIHTVVYNEGCIGYVWSEEARGKIGIKILLTVHIE